MGGRTPAQLSTLVFGVVLLLVGILGFFVEDGASFSAGEEIPRGSLLGFDVNGWHNVVHLASGVVGLATADTAARAFAIGFGVVYVLVFVLGLIMEPAPLLYLLPVNAPDHVLHLLIGVLGIAAGLASSTEPAPTTA